MKRKIPYVRLSGHLTPMELYSKLYDYKQGNLIIIDDPDFLKNDSSIAILLDACWESGGERRIRWGSTQKIRDIEDNFVMGTSRILFIINEVPKKMGETALPSRLLTYEMDMKHEEKIELLNKRIKRDKLEKKTREEIKNYITTRSKTSNWNLRTYDKISAVAKQKGNWQQVAEMLLKEDKRLSIIRKVQKEYILVKDQLKAYTEEALQEGVPHSRATFFKLKKLI